MPSYNRRGDIAFGVDSVVGWVRRGRQPHVVATNAGGAVWVDDETILYQANNAGPAPYLENSRGELVDKRGANELAGGNGRWAAALLSTPSLVYTSGFGEAPGGGKISMSRQDGTLVYVAEFNPDSRGIVAVYPHGAVSSFDAVHVASTVCADARGIGWFHDGFWFEYVENGVQTTIRLPYETYGGKMRRRPDGSLWIVYSSELAHRAICHPVTDSSHGFLFGTTDHAVNPDVIELDGVLWGCWSLTTGERPEHIRESTVTDWGALPRVTAPPVEPPPIVITPPPTTEPPPIVITPPPTTPPSQETQTMLHTSIVLTAYGSPETGLVRPFPCKESVHPERPTAKALQDPATGKYATVDREAGRVGFSQDHAQWNEAFYIDGQTYVWYPDGNFQNAPFRFLRTAVEG